MFVLQSQKVTETRELGLNEKVYVDVYGSMIPHYKRETPNNYVLFFGIRLRTSDCTLKFVVDLFILIYK